MYIFSPEKRPNFSKVSGYENAFTEAECDQIIQCFNKEKATSAGLTDTGKLNPDLRSSKITWIYPGHPGLDFVFTKVHKYAKLINDERYKFQLSGFYEAFQLAKYSVGDHYTWHEDSTEPNFVTRKLSFVVQLSKPTYEGGSLVIFPDHATSNQQGSITFFPSFLTHRVTPVKRGERYSLVGWITGEAFR